MLGKLITGWFLFNLAVFSIPAYGNGSGVTAIPASGFPVNGSNLNRYYVLLPGDTARSISKKIYGSPRESRELERWNGSSRTWSEWRIIFYSSPVDPDDIRMLPFAAEVEQLPRRLPRPRLEMAKRKAPAPAQVTRSKRLVKRVVAATPIKIPVRPVASPPMVLPPTVLAPAALVKEVKPVTVTASTVMAAPTLPNPWEISEIGVTYFFLLLLVAASGWHILRSHARLTAENEATAEPELPPIETFWSGKEWKAKRPDEKPASAWSTADKRS